MPAVPAPPIAQKEPAGDAGNRPDDKELMDPVAGDFEEARLSLP